VKYKSNDNAIKLFGKHLKSILKSKDISQEELSYGADLELSQIGRIERGVINTSISNLFLIIDALEIPAKDLQDFDYK
jgi:transcriptional regulator with XRE-family HTH domain